jgi:uncharacterized protein (DUF1501 family)
MNRKDFIKASGVGAAALALNGLPVKAFADKADQMKKIRGNTDRIFVFVILSGGNDGLNMVIPLDKYAELNSARANLVIPSNQVLGLFGTTTTGLHPAMDKVRNMYNNGLINITQGVGYPDFNYSHFRATDIYNSSSDSAVYIDNGWVGRYLTKRFIGAPNAYPDATFLDPLAVQVGNTLSTMLTGPNGQIGYALSDLNNFYQIVNGTIDPAPNTPAGHELTFLRYISLQTQAYTMAIQNAANLGTNAVAYPTDNNLADQLKIVAQLISGGSKTPFYLVELGGFDTHFNQVEDADTTIGNHAKLLTKVSEAIYAFYEDLKAQSKDDLVAGCTITEFGRRIKSNSSVGSDHGAGGPMICFGKNVIPGINGMSPNLPMNATVSDQVPMQFDFRQVYASVLEDWFGVSKADTEEILLNQPYTKLPIFKKEPAGATSVIDYNNYKLGAISIYPNPVREHATISFESTGGETIIELYTDMGKRIKTIYENQTQKGRCSINFEREQLPVGTYFFVIMIGGAKAEGKILIV